MPLRERKLVLYKLRQSCKEGDLRGPGWQTIYRSLPRAVEKFPGTLQSSKVLKTVDFDAFLKFCIKT